jgi:hypothetical protein
VTPLKLNWAHEKSVIKRMDRVQVINNLETCASPAIEDI